MSYHAALGFEITRLLIPSIIIAVGWAVVHKLSITRDQDKARKEMITSSADSLCELADDIYGLATTYHSSSRDKTVEAKIKMLLQDLNIRVSGLSRIAEEKLCIPIWNQVISFRRAVTGLHFEDEHLEPIEFPSDQFDSITNTVLGIKRQLIELKHSQFPFKP